MSEYDPHLWEQRFLAAAPFVMFGVFAALFLYATFELFLPDLHAIHAIR